MSRYTSYFLLTAFIFCLIGSAWASGPSGTHEIPNNVRVVPHDSNAFRPDPKFEDKPYSAKAQFEIYGAKYPVKTARPLLELGRKFYDSGPLPEVFTFLGVKNPVIEHFMIFGDFVMVAAYNDGQGNINDQQQGTLAFDLELEFDLAITSTERVHFLISPFDKNGDFTRWDFAGENRSFETNLDLNFDTLFFEGDFGMILAGIFNRDMGFDLPFAFGLMPLLFQNGIWVDDQFTGAAITLPALNVPALDISNMDITFFFGVDKVTTGAIANEDDARIFGFNMFIDAMEGYFEIGYGYTHDENGGDFSYHNLTAAFTRRYGGVISNSVRVIANFGQDPDAGVDETADGAVILIENSFITSLPSTLIPYLNLFAGFERPQALAKNNGGVLRNTGITFETDGQTGFPTLDDQAGNTIGGAFGVEYLFNLDQQIVLEVAAVKVIDDEEDSTANGDQFAVGLRWQLPISNATILRADAIYAFRDNDENLGGVRFEVRRKF